MEQNNSKTKKYLQVLALVIVLAILGTLTFTYKTQIKKLMGFATVTDPFLLRAMMDSNDWTTTGHAWGENVGWISFQEANSGIYVGDYELMGYAWGENIGWISLNCEQETANNCGTVDYSVKNDGAGNLSGYAWGENVGWINFAPQNGGVTINAAGQFRGFAWGENIGWINFESTGDVKTNWRYQTARVACNNGLDDDGDGKIDWPADNGCPSISGASEIPSVKKKLEDPGTVLDPSKGDVWTVGHSYYVSWQPYKDSPEAFVYINAVGNDEGMKLIGQASSTPDGTPPNYINYKVSLSDLPIELTDASSTDITSKQLADKKWTILVCTEAVVNGIENCAQSGAITVKLLVNNVVLNPVEGTEDSSTTSSSDTQKKVLTPINTVSLPVNLPGKLVIKDLPIFGGNNKDSFTFIPKITSFVFAPLPDSVIKILDKSPKLKEYLASLGISKAQSFIALVRNPLPLPTTESSVAGLYNVSNGKTFIRTYLSNDSQNGLSQLVRITSDTEATVSLTSIVKDGVTGKLNSVKDIIFTMNNGVATTKIPSLTPGKYILTTNASPLPLIIDSASSTPITQTSNDGVFNKVLKWFGI